MLPVSSAIIHQQFDYDTFDNDICLLRLGGAADLAQWSPACLPSGGLDRAGVAVWLTGWGALGEHTWQRPDQLHQLSVDTVTRAQCRQMFGQAGHDYLVSSAMLCAGGEAGRDGCQVTTSCPGEPTDTTARATRVGR